MRTIGLVGGMSWHSTAQYYRVLNEEVARRRGGHASARIAMQSLDFAEVRECQVDDDWARAGRLLAEAAQACERAGADLVLIATNLMHRVADEVQAALDVPLLHIADAVAERARREGRERLGLLATRWVMEEEFYVGRLARAGLEVHVPDAPDRAEVDRVVFEELTLGRVEPALRRRLAEVTAGLQRAGAQAVVLACTELELVLGPQDSPLPVLDSMRTHAEAAVELALDGR